MSPWRWAPLALALALASATSAVSGTVIVETGNPSLSFVSVPAAFGPRIPDEGLTGSPAANSVIAPPLQVQDELWPAVQAALQPLLGSEPDQLPALPQEGTSQLYSLDVYSSEEDQYYDSTDYQDPSSSSSSSADWMADGGDSDWLLDDADAADLLLLITTPAVAFQQDSLGSGSGWVESDPQARQTPPVLPVFAVFAGSGRGEVVPSSHAGSGVDVEVVTPALQLVAPFSAQARSPVPHTAADSFDPRVTGIAASIACVTLLLGALAVAAMRWPRAGHAEADQAERLLYGHIPGTPSKPAATAAAQSAFAAVPKKLSNLPA